MSHAVELSLDETGRKVQRSWRYGLVLWDFDGTLADTSDDVWASLQYAAGRCGGVLQDGFVSDRSNLALPVREIFSHVTPLPPESLAPQFDEDVRNHYRLMNTFASTRLYPGIRGLVGALREGGVQQWVVSNKPAPALRRVLLTREWNRFFDGWVAPDGSEGDAMTKSQLIREALELASKHWGPSVFVGDTWSDVVGAKRNGIDSIAVTYGDGELGRLVAECPTFRVDTVAQLEACLEERGGHD